MEVFTYILAFVFGLTFGSFYNVVVYRLPKGLSLVRPGSSCPKCGHKLGASELIPVLSYLWQRGLCKKCGEVISWHYPVIELLTALGFVLVVWRSSSRIEVAIGLVFFSLLFVLSLIDLEHKILPNVLTLPGLALGLIFALVGFNLSFLQSLLGAGVGFGLIFIIALISRGGMGMGDAKLMALIGAFLGWKAIFYVLFGASLVGSVVGIVYLYVTKQDRKTPIPFGPFLAFAALIYFFFDLSLA